MTKPIKHRSLKRAGRKPWAYDDDIAIEVCGRIAQGESLREICDDPRMPSNQTIYKWAAVEPIFKSAYARAREAQMERWAEEIIEIADDASGDCVQRVGKDGVIERVPDPAAVQRSRLRIDTRKWIMSKLAGKYADKVAVDVNATVTTVAGMSDAELEAATRQALASIGAVVPAGPLLLGLTPPIREDDDGAPAK